MPALLQHVTINDDGRLLAAADIQNEPGLMRATLRVEAGHLPVGTRTRLVDAVLDLTDSPAGTRIEVALPAGDGEILQRMRERCQQVDTRVAGVTCLLRATQPVGLPATSC